MATKHAIIGLIRGFDNFEEYKSVLKRNALLHQNLNHKYNYDVLIFHEGNIHKEHQSEMIKQGHNVQFVDIRGRAFVEPTGIKPEWRSSLGYKHMCRFYAIQLWEFVRPYKYVMRLDDDSYLASPIDYDLFEYMDAHDLVHGYVHQRKEGHLETRQTLPAFTKNWAKQANMTIQCSPSEINDLHYYSNFYITKVSFWLSDPVQKYLQAIDDSLGIYQHRWGDSPIQAHALRMFCRREQFKFFRDFVYIHGSHNNWSNKATPMDLLKRRTSWLVQKAKRLFANQ